MRDSKIRVAITLGDLNGIGCEVVIKTFLDERMLELCTPIIYGSGRVLAHYKKLVEGGDSFQYNTISSAKEATNNRINLIDCMGENVTIVAGSSTPESGHSAVLALRAVAADLKSGAVDVVVTAPINKESVQGKDFDFRGHTEFFASELGGAPLMLMCGDLLRVGLVTIHTPLSEVVAGISKDKITSSLAILCQSLKVDFSVVAPRIAVLSLNPHSGDGGLLGGEEESVIKPAIATANEGGILAFGPFSSDGFFASGGYAKYDAILAMYHDQGLAPFKILAPSGVNFTAGLSVVRTSPDHGVAYDIAGRGVADESSMREAIYLAIDIFRCRARHVEISKNPLPYGERERGTGKDLSVQDLLPGDYTY